MFLQMLLLHLKKRMNIEEEQKPAGVHPIIAKQHLLQSMLTLQKLYYAYM